MPHHQPSQHWSRICRNKANIQLTLLDDDAGHRLQKGRRRLSTAHPTDIKISDPPYPLDQYIESPLPCRGCLGLHEMKSDIINTVGQGFLHLQFADPVTPINTHLPGTIDSLQLSSLATKY